MIHEVFIRQTQIRYNIMITCAINIPTHDIELSIFAHVQNKWHEQKWSSSRHCNFNKH